MGSKLFFERKVESLDYDSEHNTLSIVFKNGNTRSYLEVPKRIYGELSKATDQTLYYQEHIDGHFKLG